MRLSRKAAMFGLDARISLAIFGTLSVISGAVLFQAIQRSKAITILTEMQEIGKAWEAYYLDMGETPPLHYSGDTISYQIQYLVAPPGDKSWDGPYINLEVDPSNTDKINLLTKFNETLIRINSTSAWGPTTYTKCTTGEECGAWVNYNGIDNTRWAEIIDQMVDGGDGQTVGKFRWWNNGSALLNRYELMITSIKNPND